MLYSDRIAWQVNTYGFDGLTPELPTRLPHGTCAAWMLAVDMLHWRSASLSPKQGGKTFCRYLRRAAKQQFGTNLTFNIIQYHSPNNHGLSTLQRHTSPKWTWFSRVVQSKQSKPLEKRCKMAMLSAKEVQNSRSWSSTVVFLQRLPDLDPNSTQLSNLWYFT